ncbi:MAG: MFS transporter [Acidobacteriota bacterium]|nr:MFS transporter [Acidobacteriota bacterium]
MSASGPGLTKGQRTPLTRAQKTGFWGAWAGWTLDGMDSVIYALVLSPALAELLPRSGMAATPANISMTGSLLFGLFLVGWGLSMVWGPVADRFGRTRVLAATIFVYAIFTAAAAMAQTVWQLGLFRLLAGVGIGGEWALAGTYVAEAWPEDRRKMGAGYLQTGYYAGFFLASALNYTVAAHFGWRAMFWCGLSPVLVAFVVLFRVKEPERWQQAEHTAPAGRGAALRGIFAAPYRRRTVVNSVLVWAAICGLWAGAVYTPAAIATMARRAGMSALAAVHASSYGMGLLSLGTIAGCLVAPWLAERVGRRAALAVYFAGMAVSIAFCFGWAFYRPDGLSLFLAGLTVLGFFGGNFAIFSLWLPEQYGTAVRVTAFAFATSVGRFLAAGVNFGLGAMIRRVGSLGVPVAMTALAFLVGLAVLPLAVETRGERLPE